MSRKLVSFRLSEDLAQALKDRAEEKGISVTELINRLLRKGLETDDSVEERLTVVEASVENLRKQTNVTDLALAIQGVTQSLGGYPVTKTDSNLERRLDELQELFLEMNENLNQVLEMSVVPETDSNVERSLDEWEELFLEMKENRNQVLDQDPSNRKPLSSLSKGSKSARLRNLVKGQKSSVNPEMMKENLNQVLDQEPSSRKPRSSVSKGSKSARLRKLVKGKQSSVNPEIPKDSQFRDY
ncbi:MAG: hypothetical protein F6K26_39260 [Moorea sp. SIO2I5]|nr:hypothetical protein [Moorena sp. SIO2I5]